MSTLRVLETYRAITSRLTASDIADPLFIVRPDESYIDASEATLEEATWGDNFFLVRDETTVYGYFHYSAAPDDPNTAASEIATVIPVNQIVPAETPLLDLVQLFPQYFFFFLLSRNELVGVVSYVHIDRDPVKLCLFALILELEAAMLRCLTRDYSRVKDYVNFLKPDRLEKAQKLAALKRGDKNPYAVLECTTLIDKTNIILNSGLNAMLKTAEGEIHPQRFLSRVEAVRNEIAHGGSVLRILRRPEDLLAFTGGLQRIISVLANENNDADSRV